MDTKPILDHGYLKFVESWGSDKRIIEAARMSTDKGFLGWGTVHSDNCPSHAGPKYVQECCKGKPGDEKLLGYLWAHKHTTPFEVAGMTVEVCCPVVVVWQWVRHRTMSYNILSGRYAEMPEENYIPTVERLMMSSKANKQAGTVAGAEELTIDGAETFQRRLESIYRDAQNVYDSALRAGVSKELARLVLPFARYTRMRVTANLWNWLRFLTLRMDESAQWEIRQSAIGVGEYIAELFPRTWALFAKERQMHTPA